MVLVNVNAMLYKREIEGKRRGGRERERESVGHNITVKEIQRHREKDEIPFSGINAVVRFLCNETICRFLSLPLLQRFRGSPPLRPLCRDPCFSRPRSVDESVTRERFFAIVKLFRSFLFHGSSTRWINNVCFEPCFPNEIPFL